ncbi:MAG: ATP phosphoribosyltransferase regulatory subunit [Aquificae bacterium]|nr:ATP phosphoribosyltransferase regulatory subunit [Aquificota bacterium]
MNLDLPKGIRAFSCNESFQLDYIRNNLTSLFKRWGYEYIVLPQMEYFDVHKRGTGKELENKMFRLIDRSEGEIITLRADFTAQIVRYVASLQKKEFPMRFFYYGNLFRYIVPKADNLWERKQIGIELIGVNQLEGDAEIIAVSAKALESLGVYDYQIDINNISIFSVLKEILGLEDKEYEIFMKHIKNREIYYISKFLENFSLDSILKEFLLSIPKIQGDVSVVDMWKKRLSNYPRLVEALEQLIYVVRVLDYYELKGKVVFDLGEPREFSYYTGVVFEIVASDFRKPLAQGGRYDNLPKQYGGDFSATGFAFDLLNLWKYLIQKNLVPLREEKDFYIVDLTQEKRLAYLLSQKLREKGFSVGRDIVNRDYRDSIDFALSKGYKKVIVIGIDTNNENLYIYSNRGSSEVIPFREFLQKI